MPVVRRGLPHGRHPNQPPHVQFLGERERSVPQQVRGWIAVGSPYLFSEQVAFGTANRLYLAWAEPIQQETVVNKVRISVAVGAASSTTVVALYAFSDHTYSLVPGTKAVFSTASNGIKTVSLTSDVKLQPEIRYAIGLALSNTTVNFYGSSNLFFDTFYYAVSSPANIPNKLLDVSLTTTQDAVPGVVYYHDTLNG